MRRPRETTRWLSFKKVAGGSPADFEDRTARGGPHPVLLSLFLSLAEGAPQEIGLTCVTQAGP